MKARYSAEEILRGKLDDAERLQSANVVRVLFEQRLAKGSRPTEVAGDPGSLRLGELLVRSLKIAGRSPATWCGWP